MLSADIRGKRRTGCLDSWVVERAGGTETMSNSGMLILYKRHNVFPTTKVGSIFALIKALLDGIFNCILALDVDTNRFRRSGGIL